MPHINQWEKDGLYRKFTGEITGHEILESNFGLQIQPEFQSIKYIINDFTEVTGHSIDNSHTELYAQTDEKAASNKGNSELKIALLVTQPSLIALAENYRNEMKGNMFECEIFQTIEAAREWVSKS